MRKIKFVILFVAVLLTVIYVINSAAKVLYPAKYSDHVHKYSQEYDVDPYLVFAIIKAESSFNPNAVSRKGARGLMQLMDTTADWGAKNLGMKDFSVKRLYEPEINIQIGCWYLNRLMKQFDGNVDLVIAAYNGGSGNVSGWLRDKSYSNTGKSLEKIPFKETERYLKKVKNYRNIYKKLYGREFS